MNEADLSRIDWDALRLGVHQQWHSLQQGQFLVERLGGLSNYVYKVSVPHLAQQTSPVVYKVFTPYFECLMDRKRELRIAETLHADSLAPKIYLATESYRIEEFLPYSHVPVDEMTTTKNMSLLAHLLARIHSIKSIPSHQASAEFFSNLRSTNVMQAVKQAINNSDVLKYNQREELLDMVHSLLAEENVKKIEEVIKRSASPLVLAHNDTNSTNLLIDLMTEKMVILDYEYAGFNYRAFELGNLFNEQQWDYEVKEPPFFAIKKELYPSELSRLTFFAHYTLADILYQTAEQSSGLLLRRDVEQQLRSFVNSSFEEICNAIISRKIVQYKELCDLDDHFKRLDKEAEAGKLLSHIFWFIVSALSFAFKDLEFDCYSYCKLRFSEITNLLTL